MKRWCGCLVGAFAIGIAGVAGSQEVEPLKPVPRQGPTVPRPPVKPGPSQTSTAFRPPVKPEPEPTQTAPLPSAPIPPSATAVPEPPPSTSTVIPTAAPTAEDTSTPTRSIEQSQESGSTLRTAGIITGATILGVGAVTGIAAFAMKSSWQDQCHDGTRCDPGAQGDYDTGKLLADISTGTVIGGAAILAASIFLLPSGSTRPEDGHGKAGRPSAWVSAGPHGGQVVGRVQF
jgi:hypothetical protein